MDIKAPEPIIAAIKKYAEHGIYGYVEYPELTEIPQVIAEWLVHYMVILELPLRIVKEY